MGRIWILISCSFPCILLSLSQMAEHTNSLCLRYLLDRSWDKPRVIVVVARLCNVISSV